MTKSSETGLGPPRDMRFQSFRPGKIENQAKCFAFDYRFSRKQHVFQRENGKRIPPERGAPLGGGTPNNCMIIRLFASSMMCLCMYYHVG